MTFTIYDIGITIFFSGVLMGSFLFFIYNLFEGELPLAGIGASVMSVALILLTAYHF